MLPMMLIFYFLRAHRGWMYCIIITFSLLMATLYFSQDLSQIDMLFIVNSDWMQFWVIPFIALYNGKSGPKNAFSKWFFYLAYPLHLWVFALIHLGIA
ncbi:TraX protein [Eubacterium barkeri]|uniref:TraX protein n=1 Tax=Eubacterium barkeri TaxID=1528 RepID=A0A1H3HY44_EUBBA|nr:TraX protein [Eubacterium barkeri]